MRIEPDGLPVRKRTGRGTGRMRGLRFLLCVIGLAGSIHAATLEEQLALAEEKNDSHAQIELLRRLLDKDPRNADWNEQLAALWLEVGDYDMAEAALKAWTDAPENKRLVATAEILYHRDDKAPEAIALLEGYLKSHPEDIEVTRELADYLDATNQPEKIVTLLSAAPGVDGKPDLVVDRALARRELGDYDGALADFALAKKLDPNGSPVTSNVAAFDRLETALPHIKAAGEALKAEPEKFQTLIARAYWHTTLGFSPKEGMADAEAAIEAAPGSALAVILYAMNANNGGGLHAADARAKYAVDVSKPLPSDKVIDQLLNLDVVVAKEPSNMAALAQRAFVLNDEPKQYLLAIKDADAVLAASPKNADAQLEKIYALVKLQKTNDVITELATLEAMKPAKDKLATALSYATDAAFADSRFPMALDFASRAIGLSPQAQYYKQRAAVYQRLNRAGDADADLKQATKMGQE